MAGVPEAPDRKQSALDEFRAPRGFVSMGYAHPLPPPGVQERHFAAAAGETATAAHHAAVFGHGQEAPSLTRSAPRTWPAAAVQRARPGEKPRAGQMHSGGRRQTRTRSAHQHNSEY